MIDKIFKSFFGSLIVIMIFALAFTYLLSVPIIDYDAVLRSGSVGFAFVDDVFAVLDTVGKVLNAIYTFFTKFIISIIDILQSVINWVKKFLGV